jgi:hypothetical protein
MLKAELLAFAAGIVIGVSLQYLTLNSMKEDLESITSSLDSKLNDISGQLSDFRRFDQHMMPDLDSDASNQSARVEGCLDDLKQSMQLTVETSVRTILQEQLDYIFSQMPQVEQATAQADNTADSQLERENIAKAEQIISMAISDGYWTQQYVDAYNDALYQMSSEAQAEALRQLFVAINGDEIEVAEEVVLF